MISGRSTGFGTLSNHSLQFPEPGSWTIHIPVRSTELCAAAVKHEQNTRDTTPESTLSIETKRIDRVSRSDQNMLTAIDLVSLGGIRNLADVGVPEDPAVRRIKRDQIPRDI